MKAPSAHCEALLPLLFRQLRLPTVAAHYRRLAKEAAGSGQPYEEYLLSLLEQEVSQRDVNRRKRRVQDARFPRLHALDEYDFNLMPDLPQQKILPVSWTAQEWSQPRPMKATLLRPETWPAVGLTALVVPLPSSPSLFEPQHHMVPSSRSAQEW